MYTYVCYSVRVDVSKQVCRQQAPGRAMLPNSVVQVDETHARAATAAQH